MSASRVKLTIHPSGGDEKDVLAGDFLKQVTALRDLVLLSVTDGAAVDTKIVGLSRNSPAAIEIAPFWKADSKPIGMASYFESIGVVLDKGLAPRNLGRPVFDALKEFVSVIGKGVRTATLQVGDQIVEVNAEAKRRVEDVFEPDYSAEGSIDGMLEAVNIHGNRNQFALYPVVGPSRVTCFFTQDMFGEIQPALGKYAIVNGELKYRWREKFPFEARVIAIETVDEADQPNFDTIRGLAADATRGKPSEEFVRDIRSGWH